ncbi:hypothetical protein ACOMHN_015095 [Nucella lapillus]
MSEQDPPSPQTCAEQFCQALVHRTKLPHLKETPELAEALLAYDPRTYKHKSKALRLPSLMLQAIVGNRLNAAEELYRLCPQLLTSLPLFYDDTCSSASRLTTTQRSDASTLHAHPAEPRSAAVGERNTHTCPHKRKSLLLDLIGITKKNTFLVFVLENHSGVLQQDRLTGGDPVLSVAEQTSREVKEKTGNTPKGQRSSSTPRAALKPKGRNSETKWASSNFVNVINMCIRKNNLDLLQHLLYKNLWHFFVPRLTNDKGIDDPLSGSKCTCTWFLHCAALTGSSRLVHLVLCGLFGPQSPRLTHCPVSNVPCDDSSPRVHNEALIKTEPHSDIPTDTKGVIGECRELKTQDSRHDPGTAESSSTITPSSVTEGQQTAPTFLTSGMSRSEASTSCSDPNRLLTINFPTSMMYYLESQPEYARHVAVAPLHLACWRCDPTSVQELVTRGARVGQLTKSVEISEGDWKQFEVSPLIMLVIGIRHGLDFPFREAYRLGLASNPAWNFKECSDGAKEAALEVVRVLSDANCDLNATCIINSYHITALDLLCRCTLYMPDGYSSFNSKMINKGVTETLLAVCWELLNRGATLSFRCSLTLWWEPFQLEWLLVRDEAIQKRALHLALFLGLFPPLSSVCLLGHAPPPPHSFSSSASSSQSSDGHLVPPWVLDAYKWTYELVFIAGVMTMPISTSSVTQLFHFLLPSDLRQVALVLEDLVSAVPLHGSCQKTCQDLKEAVVEARQVRTLLHTCKLALLGTVGWRPSRVRNLPMPEILRNYLISPDFLDWS